MSRDLWGAEYYDSVEYATKLVEVIDTTPLYKLEAQHTDNGCVVTVDHIIESNFRRNEDFDISVPGLYIIYSKNDDELVPDYAGCTLNCISHRVYRYMKELLNKSREDENHPAARRAREFGLDESSEIYFRYLSFDEFPEQHMYRQTLYNIDEPVAKQLKCRFNVRGINERISLGRKVSTEEGLAMYFTGTNQENVS